MEPGEPQSEANTERSAYLELKHKIFLSHSGAQKEFARRLFEALKRAHHSPFLDEDADSLPKGEKWYGTLMEAAEQCRVAVLLLSDEFFTRSKWPMMELNAFARARNANVKILPLFMRMSFEQFDKDRRGRKWLPEWKAMKAVDDRIDVNEWEQALSIIKEYNGISYNENEGEPAFIRKAVDAICKLVEPDVKFDVPDNESMGRLCLPILEKLERIARSPKYEVHVMGLYGMGGIGKTTISRAICNQKFRDFGGKVCHVEFGSKDLVELRKIVLKELTEADATILDNQRSKLADLLKTRMKWQKVFLVLDNVSGVDEADELDEVKMYLNAGYMDGSRVLVTSRSEDILVQQLGIGNCDCLEMPQLDAQGALDVFLCYIGYREPSTKKIGIIRRYVEECCFMKQGNGGPNSGEKSEKHYLPLALKVLGSQLQHITSGEEQLERYWKRYVKKLKVEKFNLLGVRRHPIFSVLRLGYDALCPEDQYIFLDLALLWTHRWRSGSFELGYMWEWMRVIHRKTKDGMDKSVNALKRNALLDMNVERDEWSIHDLYIDFAEAEAQAGPFKKRRFLLDKEGADVPSELLNNPSRSCWSNLKRLIIHSSKVQSLKKAKLERCSNVEVLHLYGCEELVEVDVGGLENLRSMEVVGCRNFGRSNHGVEKLRNLEFLKLSKCNGSFVTEFVESLSSQTALMVLSLKLAAISKLPDMSNLKQLKVIIINYCWSFRSLDGITRACALQKLTASHCSSLKELSSDLSGLKQLEELDVSCCEQLKTLGGIEGLGALRKLIAFKCTELEELGGDLSGLKQLEELDVRYCKKLKRLVGIGGLEALRKLAAYLCKELEEVGGDLSGLKQLEVLDVRDCVKLRRLEGIGGLGALRKLTASCSTNLEELGGDLSGLKQLEELDISYCWKVKRLVGIGGLGALQKLDAVGCEEVEELGGDLSGLKQLEVLDVRGCKMKTLRGIRGLGALRELTAAWCANLEEVGGDLSGLKQLEELDVSCCWQLKTLGGIEGLGALRKLIAYGCRELEELGGDLSRLKQLEELDVRDCVKLKRLGGIGGLGALRKLIARECRELEELGGDLSRLKQLEELDVSYCYKLKRLGGIGGLGALRKLAAYGCRELEELGGDLSGLKQLEELGVSYCVKLKTLGGIRGLGALRKLDAEGCVELEELGGDLSGLKQLTELNVSCCK